MRTVVLFLAILCAAGTVAIQFGCKPKGKATQARTVGEPRGGEADDTDKAAGAADAEKSPPAEIAVDQTASSDMSVLEPSAKHLTDVIESRRLQSVAVLRLGEDGKSSWAGSKRDFALPLIPADVFDEAGAENSMERQCWARLRCRNERLQKMRGEFDRAQTEKSKTMREERAARSKEIFDLIISPTQGSAVCSDLASFRDRLIADGFRRVVLYSDGKHDCPTPIVTKRFAPDVKVLVLQMPLKGEGVNNDFAERTKTLEKIFVGDGVTIIPAVSADRRTFDEFLR